MKVLITGANGYIGKALADVLSHEYEVTAIARPDLDLCNREQVKAFFDGKFFDCVIHTAVRGGKRTDGNDPRVLEDNLVMLWNILSCKDSYANLINFATGAEYDREENINVVNKSLINSFPEDYYGMSKNIISRVLADYKWAYNMRVFGCFGFDELDQRFIKGNLKRYINREPLELHQNKLFDFIFLPDLIDVVMYYLYYMSKKPLAQEIDLCYTDKVDLYHVLTVINQLEDYECEIKVTDTSLGKDYCGDGGYVHNLHIPLVGLELGIELMYMQLVGK